MDCAHRMPLARSALGIWGWNTVFKRFRRWVKADAFYRMFSALERIAFNLNQIERDPRQTSRWECCVSLAEDADFEYAMIDGAIVKVHRHGPPSRSTVKVHRHGQGAKGGLKVRPSVARQAIWQSQICREGGALVAVSPAKSWP